MSATHADRQAVYESLEPVLGDKAALRIMDYLHFTPERELVSSSDLHANTSALQGEMAELQAGLRGEMGELRSELRGEMAQLRAELQSEMGELRTGLRGEMGELRTELQSEMGELRIELTGEMAELRSELRGEMAEFRIDLTNELSARFDQQTRWMVGLISTNIAALIGAVVAIVLAFNM